jgi:putative ABC transport system permease protein
MKYDLFVYAVNNLKSRFLRSGLTILSILIGIMAIFVLVSFGQGLSKYTADTFEKMGTNKIMIQPKGFGPPGSSSSSFSDSDLKAIGKVSGTDVVAGMYFTYGEVKRDTKSRMAPLYVQTMGVPVDGKEGQLVLDMLTVDVIDGKYLRDSDKQKIVAGYSYAQENKAFVKPIGAGDSIIVHGVEMKVNGILDSIGNPADDKTIIMPIDYYEELFDVEDSYTYVYVTVKEDFSPSVVADKVAEELRDNKNQEEGQEDFHVQTFEDLMKTSGAVLMIINSIVIIIALISVVVAAINITNTMYTSVLERTQEIGIMKAIGARNSDILSIFLVESGIIGLLGGLVGIGLGFAISKLGGFAAAAGGFAMLQPYFPVWLFVFCLGFSTSIGMVSGLLPALNASKQKPVDALRYE